MVHRATGDGRLTLAEVDERLKDVYAAKTIGELRPIVADLPGHELALPRPDEVVIGRAATGSTLSAGNRIVGGDATGSAVAFMSGSVRKGTWVVPRKMRAVALMGGVELDLTEAMFAAPEVTIQVVAMMGGVEITVPDDVTVISEAFGVMGGVENHARAVAPPGSPVVRITGVALMGGIEIGPPKRRRLDRRA